jgi:hypothetical protein
MMKTIAAMLREPSWRCRYGEIRRMSIEVRSGSIGAAERFA